MVSLVSGVLLLPFGRIADARGRRPIIIAGLAVGAAGFALLATVPTIAGLMIAMALLGFAGASDSVAPGAMLGDIVGGRGGTVVAVFQMAGDLGAVLGPVVAGALADGPGYGAAFMVSALVSLVPIPCVAAARETLVRDGSQAQVDQ
jgi:MFS family permease